ncbi:hypothetical protein [Paenibacillus ginsengihumi]|uniref:hypothetical protein n=1 Tax=Paenibacillus ginsengihumi TaxID=431596 RepID=UPI00036E7D5D|nr:hypothetical protein [Paenibacillus ginsengihumi]
MEAAQERVDEVKSRVVGWIEGKHSRIGIILPDHDPNPEDMSEIYHTLAEVAVGQAKRKAAQE